MRIAICIISFIIVTAVELTYGDDISADMGCFLRWAAAISMSASLISLIFLREHYLALSSNELTYVYHNTLKQKITEIFEWSEIERFEKLDSFIFLKKINIIIKTPYGERGRNCKIWIHNSQIPRDELCDILNEKLHVFNKSDVID